MNRHWVAFFLGLFLLGCPKRLNFGPGGEISDPNTLLRLVAAQEDGLVSLEGEGRVKVDAPSQRGASGIFVSVHRPGLIRIEALDFFGRPQAVLVCNGETFGLFNAQEGRYYKGPATAANLAKLAPLALPPQELVRVMLGQAPRIPAETTLLKVERDPLAYLLTLKTGSIEQYLRIHPSIHRVMQSRVVGAQTYDLDFDDFREKNGVSFPGKVTLSTPSARTRVELEYKDVTVNGPLDLTMFEIAPPPHVLVIEVDGLGNPIREERF